MSKEERNRVVEENTGLAFFLARKYHRSTGIPLDDLVQVGCIGLIKAVEKYDPDRGTAPATFYGRCIENEIRMLLRSNRKHEGVMSLDDRFIPTRGADKMCWYEVIPDNQDYIEETLNSLLVADILEKYYHKLSKLERQVFRLTMTTELKQREIADELGVSQSYVSRVVKGATTKLRAGAEYGYMHREALT